MSIYSAEGSSALSDTAKNAVKEALGEDCLVCGTVSFVDVAHIIPKNVTYNSLVHTMRSWASSLLFFRKTNVENFLVLCPSHHREYDAGLFTIVPNAAARKTMIEHEEEDFKKRREAVERGEGDPGRRLLFPPNELAPGYEYIPIDLKFMVQVYNRAPNEVNIYDTHDLQPHPGGLVNLYPYPLLIRSFQPLNNPSRKDTARIKSAFDDVTKLIDLYRRGLYPTVTPAGYRASITMAINQAHVYLSPHAGIPMPTIPEAPNGGAAATGDQTGDQTMEDHGVESSIQAPTDRSDGGIGDEGPARVATENVPEDENEPAVTPAVLLSRVPRTVGRKFDPDVTGSMRFATSSDFIIKPGMPYVYPTD